MANNPLYILVINDKSREATICRRVDATAAPVPTGTYEPYAVGERTAMKQLYRDLTYTP